MKTTYWASEQINNPTFIIKGEMSADEVRELESYMSDHTGPSAPTSFKELLVLLRECKERA